MCHFCIPPIYIRIERRGFWILFKELFFIVCVFRYCTYVYVVCMCICLYFRLTWFVLVAVTTFTAIHVSFLLSQRYNTSLLSTVVESTYYHISEIPYPGVSICNFNRINYKKVNAAIERYIYVLYITYIYIFRNILLGLHMF